MSVLLALALSAVYTERLVVPPGAFPANHASTIAETGDGSLLTCWFAGSAEAQRDVRIVCSRLAPLATAEWSEPAVAVDAGEHASGATLANKFIGNPVLHRDDDGILWLFYEAVQVGGHSGATVQYKTSRDDGRTWSGGKALAGGLTSPGHLPRNKPLRLADGRVMLPLYREFTSDYGYTLTLTLHDGAITAQEKHVIPGTGHLQPSLVARPDGSVLAYLRNKDAGNVLVARFDPAAGEWSAPVPTDVPNPNAAVDALALPDGRILLAHNPSHTERNPLSLAVSRDGVTFTRLWDLESAPSGSFAYPALFRATDGTYHVTYTYKDRAAIKHVTFDEEWLASRGR